MNVLWARAIRDRARYTPAVHRHYVRALDTPAARRATWEYARELLGSSDWYEGLWRQRERTLAMRVTSSASFVVCAFNDSGTRVALGGPADPLAIYDLDRGNRVRRYPELVRHIAFAGDRIVELALWTFFAVRRDARGEAFVAYWVPLVIITRTVLTDLIRSVAFGEGRTPFGADGAASAALRTRLMSSCSSWSGSASIETSRPPFTATFTRVSSPAIRRSSGPIETRLRDGSGRRASCA